MNPEKLSSTQPRTWAQTKSELLGVLLYIVLPATPSVLVSFAFRDNGIISIVLFALLSFLTHILVVLAVVDSLSRRNDKFAKMLTTPVNKVQQQLHTKLDPKFVAGMLLSRGGFVERNEILRVHSASKHFTPRIVATVHDYRNDGHQSRISERAFDLTPTESLILLEQYAGSKNPYILPNQPWSLRVVAPLTRMSAHEKMDAIQHYKSILAEHEARRPRLAMQRKTS